MRRIQLAVRVETGHELIQETCFVREVQLLQQRPQRIEIRPHGLLGLFSVAGKRPGCLVGVRQHRLRGRVGGLRELDVQIRREMLCA